MRAGVASASKEPICAVPHKVLGDTQPSITPAPVGCHVSGLQEGRWSQALKEGKAAKKREPALTCSEAQGKKQEQGWILYRSKAQGKGMCWGESRRKKVGWAGAGICTLYPSPPKGWTGIWDISAGGVVVPARTCGSNPQNASLHSTHKALTHQSYSYSVRSIPIILSVYEGPLLLLPHPIGQNISVFRACLICIFQGCFSSKRPLVLGIEWSAWKSELPVLYVFMLRHFL